MKNKIKLDPRIIIYIIFAVFSFWMAAQLPYTHDDWDWGLSYGIDQLLHATINSRYVGNFLVVIMTRSPFIKTVIVGLGYFLIPFLLSRVALYDREDTGSLDYCVAFILSAIFLFMMPRAMWSQTYGWISGFANYGVSAIFLMFWLHNVNLAFKKNLSISDNNSALRAVCFFVIAVAGQLFLENLALYNVLLALTLCIVFKKRLGKVPLSNFALVLGAVVGLIIMFSSSLYGEMLSDVTAKDGMRRLIWSTGSEPVVLLYYFLFQLMMLTQGLCEYNTFTAIFIMLVLAVLLISRREKAKDRLSLIFVIINLLYIVYLFFVRKSNPLDDGFALYGFSIIIFVNVFYFVIVGLETIYLFKENRLLLGKLILFLCSGPVLIAPLVITLDSGSRLYFTSNIFLYCYLLIIIFEASTHVDINVKRLLSAAAVVLLMFNMTSFGYKYYRIGECKRYRDACIAQALEEKVDSFTLPDYPYAELMWCSHPYDYLRYTFFKEFYNIPESTTVNFIENINR